MNIAQVLKAEISRISRREAKALSSTTRSSTIILKKTVADLKQRLATLEKTCKDLQKQVETLVQAMPKPVEEPEVKGRISGKGVKSLRKKLGISQTELGKLVGVSLSAVVHWEKKTGVLKLRDSTKKALMSIRGMGKAEARKILDEIEVNAPRKKGTSRNAKSTRTKGKGSRS